MKFPGGFLFDMVAAATTTEVREKGLRSGSRLRSLTGVGEKGGVTP